jgi:phosphoglycolate phosphatase
MSLILFDLDGTLIDSEIGIGRSLRHAFERIGESDRMPAEFRSWIGPPLRQSFSSVFGEGHPLIERAVAHYRERFDQMGWAEHQIYPGVGAAVEAFAEAGHRLAIVTTKVRVQAEKIVRHLPFGHRFERIYGPGPEGAHSEKAGMIATALADFAHPASDTMMIGDRHFDIEGARANRVRGIGVLWGFGGEQELRSAGAERMLASPAELLGLMS